jgi:PIN domain
MKNNYVLIDYENVQPENLGLLRGHPVKVIVFVGSNQSKIPIELARDLQPLGENVKYVEISGNGRNALDFHIAYYLGKMGAEDPDGYFHIISKDTGYDPLITHLRKGKRKVLVQRSKDLSEIPLLRVSTTTNKEERISAIVENLVGRGQSRPRKVETLANTINSLFLKKLDETEPAELVGQLEEQGYIVVNQGNIKYNLPEAGPK